MKIFFPVDPNSLVYVMLEIFILLSIGWILVNRKNLKWIGWSLPIISVGTCHFYLLNENAGFRMLALILVLLLAMKILVGQYFVKKFPLKKWLLFSLSWVGMKPLVFFERISNQQPYNLFIRGFLFLILGMATLLILHAQVNAIKHYWQLYLISIALLISLSWILHFGLLNINAAFLKTIGYAAYPLFDRPLLSNSLQEFWGKRWNLAFTEMTSTIAYKPLISKIDRRAALFLSFMFSGLLHEVALSLSVQKGYGLPMLYFLLQSLVIGVEKRFFKKKKPGKVWVIFWLLIPLPLVFHIFVMREVFLLLILD